MIWSFVRLRRILLGRIWVDRKTRSAFLSLAFAANCELTRSPSTVRRRLITWTTTWSLLDLPACTVPVGELDPLKDAPSPPPEAFFSQQDQRHWDSCASLVSSSFSQRTDRHVM